MKRTLASSVMIVMVCLGLGIGSFASPTPAAAGSNGQQIYVTPNVSGVTATYIKIEGNNNNNQWATYERNLGVPGYQTYWANGWWFKGSVKITLGLSIANPGQSKIVSCWVSVPTSQSGDWVRVNYNAQGCWR